MPAGSEAYYDSLFGPETGAPAAGLGGKAGGLLSKPGIKGAGLGVFATWLLNKVLQTGHETGMRNIQREGLRSQAEMVTPENLYFQAAQPQAQQEESMARTAMLSQLSGGVLGPSLAKGEYLIGG
ncbi:hypothetical protein KAR91_14525 [Candidatus Pacearchaeota archaeon]|nr:hypothetical protein [Candidatus Pacearchaeota archaeon]